MYRKFWACLRSAARAACLVRPPAWAGRLVRAGLAGLLAVPVVAVAALGTASPAVALGNGLALTPPMGFNDWNAYGCNVSESLIKQTAAGHAQRRHAGGRLPVRQHRRLLDGPQPGRSREPGRRPGQVPRRHRRHRQLRPLARPQARHLRGRGHRDLRRVTPAASGTSRPTRDSFASWGVDYLKYDNCNTPFSSFPASRTSRSRRRCTPRCATRWPPPAARSCSACATWGSSVQPWTWARRRRQPVAHHRRHQRQLRQHAVHLPQQRGPGLLRRARGAGTTRTCWRSATG